MCFDYAMLTLQQDSGAKEAVSILRRALDLQPDYLDARLQLGMLLASRQDFAGSIDQLRQIKKVNPDQAPSYFLALGYSYFGASHPDEARKNAEASKKWAKTAADSERADALLRLLDSAQSALQTTRTASAAPAPPPVATRIESAPTNSDPDRPRLARRPAPEMEVHQTAPRNPFIQKDDQINRVEGTAQSLDCEGGSLQLHVSVGRASMVFEIPDPDRVLIQHAGEAQHDFTCGVQKPYPVTVLYAAKPDLKKGTAGIVRELDF
jgi:tetratricopeptide (TPR) repeat protein